MLREVYEETGLTLESYHLRGIVTFLSDCWEGEYMFLYTSDQFSGEIRVCDEGDLQWVEKEKVMDLSLWEGDRIFLKKLMENEGYFSLKLRYEGERLAEAREY